MLLGGSRIPDKCVLAAGSVLAGAYDETNSLYGGQPARKIKDLDPNRATSIEMTGMSTSGVSSTPEQPAPTGTSGTRPGPVGRRRGDMSTVTPRITFFCGSLEPGRDGVGDYTRALASELSTEPG